MKKTIALNPLLALPELISSTAACNARFGDTLVGMYGRSPAAFDLVFYFGSNWNSDLELTFDRGGDQTIGMRFTNVAIPPGATIHSASVQFQTDEVSTVPTSLLIDEDGKVLWMDQSENYQRRSGPNSVLAALRTHLD